MLTSPHWHHSRLAWMTPVLREPQGRVDTLDTLLPGPCPPHCPVISGVPSFTLCPGFPETAMITVVLSWGRLLEDSLFLNFLVSPSSALSSGEGQVTWDTQEHLTSVGFVCIP